MSGDLRTQASVTVIMPIPSTVPEHLEIAQAILNLDPQTLWKYTRDMKAERRIAG